jgi:hypothetical protein
VPGILKLGETADARAAFHAELYWIHTLTLGGTRLLNREAQPWFYERYHTLFSPRAEAPAAPLPRPQEKPSARREDPRPKPAARHGAPWTSEEDRALMRKLEAGMSPAQIAAQHRRSDTAIEKRIAALQEGDARPKKF